MKNDTESKLVQLGILEDAVFLPGQDKRANSMLDQYALQGSLAQFMEITTRVRDLLVQRVAQSAPTLQALDELIELIKLNPRGRNAIARGKRLLAALRETNPEACDLVQAVNSAEAALVCIGDAIEIEGVAEETVNKLIWCGMEIGRLLARIEVRPTRKFIDSGKRQRIYHPKAMREARSKTTDENRKKRCRQAEEAVNLAKYKFPEEASDRNISFLKGKAAQHLGISAHTLNRWLREK